MICILEKQVNKKHLPHCVEIIDGTFGFYHRREEMNTRKCHYGFNVVLICDDRGVVRQGWYDQSESEADSTILRESSWYSDVGDHLGNLHDHITSLVIKVFKSTKE